MNARRSASGLVLAGSGVGLIVFLAMVLTACSAGADERVTLDCGVNALFVLLQLEGRPVTFDRLLSVLPRRHPEGYSMAELASAARSLGLNLDGVRFARGDRSPGRPAIAFLKDAKGGHFAVLRPIGVTGTMVQVIDPPHAPWIVDYDRLFTARPWTGRILLARGPWVARHAIALTAFVASLLVLAAIYRHRSRSARVVASTRTGGA